MKIKKYNKTNKINIAQIIMLLFLFLINPLMCGASNFAYKITLLIFIGIIFIMCYIFKDSREYIKRIVINRDSTEYVKIFYWIFLLLCLLSVFNSGINFKIAIRFIQIFACYLIFCLSASLKIKERNLKIIKNFIEIYIICIFLYWIFIGMPMKDYEFLLGNPNSVGKVIFNFIVLISLGMIRKRDLIVLILAHFILYVSSCRSMLIADIIYFIVLFIYKKTDNKKWSKLVTIEIFVLIFFIFFYIAIYDTYLGNELDLRSIEYFGKAFFSGRQLIWIELIEVIKKQPFLGYGLDKLPGDLTIIKNSAHNSYLQISMQIGIIGGIFLILILKNIVKSCENNKYGIYRKYSIAFVFAIIFAESFEVSIIENFLYIALQSWFLMGLGCNKNLTEEKK